MTLDSLKSQWWLEVDMARGNYKYCAVIQFGGQMGWGNLLLPLRIRFSLDTSENEDLSSES